MNSSTTHRKKERTRAQRRGRKGEKDGGSRSKHMVFDLRPRRVKLKESSKSLWIWIVNYTQKTKQNSHENYKSTLKSFKMKAELSKWCTRQWKHTLTVVGLISASDCPRL